MTGPVRLTDLRARATRIATRYPGAYMAVESDVVLALVDAAEALERLVRFNGAGWLTGTQPSWVADPVNEALAGFDFTDDQPTTTKGET